MNIQQALTYTHSLKRLGKTPGLACLQAVLEKLGNPQENLSVIHVAGTNGKGSVCAMTAAIYQAAGYKVGLFTSPYLVSFYERIQINGELIPAEEYARLATKVKAVTDEIGEELSQFAFITAVGFCWFYEQACDVVVLETGLGGRLDATNVVTHPLVTAITSVGLDHTDLLGDTLEQIAAEKCGIIKQNVPVVLSPDQPPQVIAVAMERAAKQQSQVILPNPSAVAVKEIKPAATRFAYGGQTYSLALGGGYQPYNGVTAIETVKAARLPVTEQAIRQGLATAVHPARCQVLRAHPLILLDGAHNPQGAQALSQTLTAFLGDQKAVGVCGVMSDKAAADLAGAMGGHLCQLIGVAPHNPRALPARQVADIFAPYCETATAEVDADLLNTLWGETRPVVIFGSLYLAGEILTLIKPKGEDSHE
ncbi:MAG: bifunctional folylpolyglutamate synthase/dihydrofolate synthase [Clostridia bacterium]|nr:bifunctional folylpolyglutamate synthase/dihydrofolate synthase [Clostridia bacterium]